MICAGWPYSDGWARACGDQSTLLARAANLYVQRQDVAKAEQAAHLYAKVMQVQPACAQAALGRAQALVWVRVFSQGERELAAYRAAIEAAAVAVAAAPQEAAGYYWLGAAQGLNAKASSGPLTCLVMLEEAKANLARALALEPAYESGGPDRVLGRLYFKLPVWCGGDRTLAEYHLRRALELGPHYWLNHLYLAAFCLDQDKVEQARALLEQVARSRPTPGYGPEHRLWQQEAVKLLRGIQDR